MKTHITKIKQIFTVVSFFSLSLSTTLAISWGINGLTGEGKIDVAQCLGQDNIIIEVIQSKDCKTNNTDSVKILTPKITIK